MSEDGTAKGGHYSRPAAPRRLPDGAAAPAEPPSPIERRRALSAILRSAAPNGEQMLYFAYGSNLNAAQMARRCPDHKVVGVAVLRDHRLTFPLTSHDWGGGVSSVQAVHGSEVWGVVYELGDADVESLDRYEGFRGPGDQHNLYDREFAFVDLTRPDDGSIPRRVRALIYLARPSNPAPPSRRYLDTILEGARHHRLPEDYLGSLARVATLE